MWQLITGGAVTSAHLWPSLLSLLGGPFSGRASCPPPVLSPPGFPTSVPSCHVLPSAVYPAAWFQRSLSPACHRVLPLWSFWPCGVLRCGEGLGFSFPWGGNWEVQERLLIRHGKQGAPGDRGPGPGPEGEEKMLASSQRGCLCPLPHQRRMPLGRGSWRAECSAPVGSRESVGEVKEGTGRKGHQG